jgi:hypothetical protein
MFVSAAIVFAVADEKFVFAGHKFSIAGKALHTAHLCACTGVFWDQLELLLF